jgi:transcription-repair coupling factor (superfamily II helicase)
MNISFLFLKRKFLLTDRKKKATKAHRSLKRYLAALAKLQENDFIVHIDYGIGCYRGLKHLIVEGTGHDFLQLEYAGDSTLYLPVENIGRIQKFVAEEGKVPKLDKLGSTRWARAKAKVKHSLVTLAGDLIKLYAARQEGKGWRFEPYGAEDERFADGFGYTETIDQQAAITETLQDMAIERPMDRLICGDAGYGKTEVALRASFKCAQHARQVAILVPTTLLVEQHYKVFAERFLGYPVRVGAISRLHTSEANKATLAALASGEIDIIIGTHALLQPRVHFRDLGLVIIDEEHRFGVKHKERLKQIRKNVDVLTLTATPIPRTLHMALLGIRDISIITTPPTDRRSVRTYVAPHSENLIRDAILRELQRGGQCFYLHNKVANIATVTHQLRQLVPEARFVFGHGQMNERELERVMLQFIDKKADVLVSTTIIESGIDIPNANTIIVNRADQFGLAQLYQIRGRVGRSDRQAYAYLLVPEAAKLGSQAQQRLIVLQTLDELGAGFTLATRDLEIRGAGNLLGKDQSGFVQTVGLDLYNRILKEAILNLRGEELDIAEITDPELKLGIDAYIPETYIPDVTERLILYQRLSNLRDSLETDDLVAEIEDRFGHATEEVYNLIELMRLRALLRQHGIVQAELGVHRILFTFSAARPVPLDKIRAACKRKPKEFRISSNNTVSCAVRYESHEDPKLLYREVRGILGVLV